MTRHPGSLGARAALRGLARFGLAIVRRVEPRALVARSERLQDTFDLLTGGRTARETVLDHALLELERRAVLAPVHVHGHPSKFSSTALKARAPRQRWPRSRPRTPRSALPWRLRGSAYRRSEAGIVGRRASDTHRTPSRPPARAI